MGILNVTPDSFSDGGRYETMDAALRQVDHMLEGGADIIDVGGESTRPGAASVDIEQELQRTIPVIEAIRAHANVEISIDTSKTEVMRQAIAAGATMINDVTALSDGPALQTVAELGVPVCLMHMQGEPRTMQASPSYPDGVVAEVLRYLSDRVDSALAAGISRENIVIDPGFGFGKTLQHNYELLADLEKFTQLGCKLLVGISRKSMIGNLLHVDTNQRLPGSLASAVIAAERGADILRVHDVRETVQALTVWQATNRAKAGIAVTS